MNDHTLDWRATIRAPARPGPTSACNSGFGTFAQPQAPMEFQSPASLARVSPSSTIMSRFESPASAFYAAESCMGFPQYDSSGSYAQFSGDSYAFEPPARPGPVFGFRNPLEAAAKPNDDDVAAMFGHGNRIGPNTGAIPIDPKENREIADYGGSFSSPFSQVSFASSQRLDTQQPHRLSPGNCALMSNGSAAIASKSRIRWNQELHEKFVECVHRLGGADKATPKAILKLMDSEGVTIFHVKSHLQKYRIAKYLPDSIEGKAEKRAFANVTTQLEATTGMQIKEALQLQLDVQRRLHDQLEIQRKLQLQIEEQGKQLKMMFDIQQRTSNNLLTSTSSEVSSLEEAPFNSMVEASESPNLRSKIS